MAQKKAFEALLCILKSLRGNENSFSIVHLFYFPAILEKHYFCSTTADELNVYLELSVLWPNVQELTLNINVRVHYDASAKHFAKQLLDIGNGKMAIDESTKYITL